MTSACAHRMKENWRICALGISNCAIQSVIWSKITKILWTERMMQSAVTPCTIEGLKVKLKWRMKLQSIGTSAVKTRRSPAHCARTLTATPHFLLWKKPEFFWIERIRSTWSVVILKFVIRKKTEQKLSLIHAFLKRWLKWQPLEKLRKVFVKF